MNRRKAWRSLTYSEQTGVSAWLGRVLSYVATLVLLGLALMFSFVVFAVLAVLGIVVGTWFWWKTRTLRRELERAGQSWQESQDFRQTDTKGTQGTQSTQGEGAVIEGHAHRVEEDAGLLPEQGGQGEPNSNR